MNEEVVSYEEAFKYLSYVTIREAWGEVKEKVFAWLWLFVISFVIGDLIETGTFSATESFWSAVPNVPKPVQYVLVFAVLTWLFRGGAVRFVIPRTFKLWLLDTFLFAIIVFGDAMLPTWAKIPLFFGYLFALLAFGSLVRMGKANYQRLTGAGREDERDQRARGAQLNR